MDGPVARRNDPDLARLLDRFVAVRVVQMWGVDLARFQFDWDLTWAAVFLNADGTVYARYGTAGKDTRDDLEGFRKAAEGALELHSAYPGNAKSLAGKQPPTAKWPTPEAIPHLKGREGIKPATGERATCVHCHQVGEGELWSRRAAGAPIHDRQLWAHPDTSSAGFTMKEGERATVFASVCALKPGDRILSLGGQPIVSMADVRWVLHHAEDGDLEAEVDRDGERLALKLPLAAGWRRKGDYSWRTISWGLRHRLSGTGPLDTVPAAGRDDKMALRIKRLPPNWVKDRNLSAAEGLKDGDVIVELDGRRDLVREADFLAYLIQKKAPGSEVSLTVLRNGQSVAITLKLP